MIKKYSIVLGITLLITGTLPSSAVEYQLEEDFSDPEQSGWIMTSDYWDSEPQVLTIQANFTLNNGYLESTGDFHPDKFNAFRHAIDLIYGAIRLTASFPERTELGSGYNFLVAFVPPEAEFVDIGERFDFSGTGVGIKVYVDEVRTHNDVIFGTKNPAIESIPNELRDYDVFREYTIVLTPESINVFIDTQLISVMEYNEDDFVFGYLILSSNQGSNVKFDNLRVTSDYDGVCLEMGYSSCPTELPSESSGVNTSGVNNLPVVVGVGAVATIAIFSGYYTFKKKHLAKLIKISSNGKYPNVSKGISELFKNKKSLYFMLLGQKSHKLEPIRKSYEATLSNEMKKHRDILHPFRLNILKLLNLNDRMPSNEMKRTLDLSWSEYYHAINLMEKKEYIGQIEDFDNTGTKRMFIYLEEEGRKVFEELVSLLDDFIEQAKDIIPDSFTTDDLYPKD